MHLRCQKQIRECENTIRQLRGQLLLQEHRISELTALLDKYQSIVLSPTELLTKVEENAESALTRKRGIGISAEPNTEDQIQSRELTRHTKSERDRRLIQKAILENDFMKQLASDQVNVLIDCMHSIKFSAGDLIITEGDYGSLVYVLAEGRLEISKDGQKIREVHHPTVLGELAILYNCKRTASVKAISSALLWAIDRTSFQTILMQKHLQQRTDHLSFIKSVPIFESLPDSMISKLADQLGEVTYKPGEYIVRQGARGDNLFIIHDGKVKVTINEAAAEPGSKKTEEQFVREMGRGEWFGERALKGDHLRTANIIATGTEPVMCLTLDYETYNLIIGDLVNLDRRYSAEKIQLLKSEVSREAFKDLTLEDLTIVTTLGCGGFGRVEMVQIKDDSSKTYALKKMKKHHILATRQQEHVINERNVMLQLNSDFIVKLWRTFKDKKYLYLLMEVCQGGELWSLLRDCCFFPEHDTQFYVACVLEALDYLHQRGIVYRDLKPENLILDSHGYCKITDLGFAKYIPYGGKTWTFCGTPEYMAPEIILNKGHDVGVDFWSYGVLLFELLTGMPPFESPDAMRTYGIILKGIDAISFPTKISKNAQNLIKRLCRDNPAERFGYGKGGIREIEKHVWFEGFDWEGLRSHQLNSPHKRSVKSPLDSSYFDACPEDLDIPPDETSGWDECF